MRTNNRVCMFVLLSPPPPPLTDLPDIYVVEALIDMINGNWVGAEERPGSHYTKKGLRRDQVNQEKDILVGR